MDTEQDEPRGRRRLLPAHAHWHVPERHGEGEDLFVVPSAVGVNDYVSACIGYMLEASKNEKEEALQKIGVVIDMFHLLCLLFRSYARGTALATAILAIEILTGPRRAFSAELIRAIESKGYRNLSRALCLGLPEFSIYYSTAVRDLVLFFEEVAADYVYIRYPDDGLELIKTFALHAIPRCGSRPAAVAVAVHEAKANLLFGFYAERAPASDVAAVRAAAVGIYSSTLRTGDSLPAPR